MGWRDAVLLRETRLQGRAFEAWLLQYGTLVYDWGFLLIRLYS